jgi:hypothetical protein
MLYAFLWFAGCVFGVGVEWVWHEGLSLLCCVVSSASLVAPLLLLLSLQASRLHHHTITCRAPHS